MAGGIYLRQGEDLVAMTEQPYESEDLLQGLLEKHPALLAGDQHEDEPRRWLLLAREASLASDESGGGRMSVDHLFVDQHGVPTLVEVKRSSDTRIRREVVGQMLDYAANAVVCWQLERLRAGFEAACMAKGQQTEEILAGFMDEEDEPEDFWQRVKTNLAAGNLRLVFVADQIPSELRRIVEFLNGQMTRTEVLAVEVKQYVDSEGHHQTLVPRLVGQTEAARQVKGRAEGRSWDKDAVLDEIERKRGTSEAAVARQIFEWVHQRGDLRSWFGTGKRDGSFQAGLDTNTAYIFPFCLYTYGRIEIQFQWIMRRPPFDVPDPRIELQRKLNVIQAVDIPDDALTKRPSIALAALSEDGDLKHFLSAMDWSIEQAQRFGQPGP